MTSRRGLLLLFALGICSFAHAEDTRRDGNWWRTQTAEEKANYMVGVFDGMDLGMNFSWWGVKTAAGNPDGDHLRKVSESYGDLQKRYMKNVTNLQISDGLTKFFDDYRNRSILVSDGVWVVLRTIAGSPQAELDSLTENLRKHASK